MRTVGIVLAVLVLGGIATFFSGLIEFDAPVAEDVCRVDEEIDAVAREAATAAARTFFEKLLKGDLAAYEALSPEAQTAATRASFEASAKKVLAAGRFDNLKADHAYEPVVSGETTHVSCGAPGANQVSVAALPGVIQMHVTHSAEARNNGWALTAWLVQTDGQWRVHAFDASTATMVGHDTATLLRMANEQKDKGHALSAHMLYIAAQTTADRGPSLRLGVKQDLDDAVAAHEPPAEVKGEPPYVWRHDGSSFRVEQISILGIDNKLGLLFLHRDPTWDGQDTGKAERRNKRLIDAFVKAHPGYAESFGFLVARLLEPGKSTGWGTVFDAAKGYDTGEPSTKGK